MQTVILAGGLGQRLRPLTEKVPKPMVEVLGRPYLEYQIKWLRSNGLKDIIILTGYLGEKIESYFSDGSSFGVKIKYSHEPRPLGTGGALRLASGKIQSDFILIYGDSFLPMDFSRLTAYFLNSGKKGVVVVCGNSARETGVVSNISLGKDGLILKYEKNSKDISLNFTEAGVMIFKKEAVNLIPENVKVSLEEEIFPALIKDKELAGYVSEEIFYDIGTADRLKNFEKASTKYF